MCFLPASNVAWWIFQQYRNTGKCPCIPWESHLDYILSSSGIKPLVKERFLFISFLSLFKENNFKTSLIKIKKKKIKLLCGFSQDPYWNLQVLQRERMVCLYFQYVSRVLLFHVPDHDTSLRWNYYRVTAQKKNSTKSCKYKENRGSSICSRSLWSPRKFFKATHWKKKVS